MFCKKCGAQLAEGERFCPACGADNAPQQPAQPMYQQPAQPVYQQPVYVQPVQKPGKGLAIASMVLGIIGVVFVLVGYFAMFYLFYLSITISLVGLILGAVATAKAVKARKAGQGDAAGFGMAIAGLVMSCVAFVVAVSLYAYVFIVILGVAGAL